MLLGCLHHFLNLGLIRSQKELVQEVVEQFQLLLEVLLGCYHLLVKLANLQHWPEKWQEGQERPQNLLVGFQILILSPSLLNQ